MAKAEKTKEIQGTKGEKIVVAWMKDGRILIKFSGKIAILSFFPGNRSKNSKSIITIQPI